MAAFKPFYTLNISRWKTREISYKRKFVSEFNQMKNILAACVNPKYGLNLRLKPIWICVHLVAVARKANSHCSEAFKVWQKKVQWWHSFFTNSQSPTKFSEDSKDFGESWNYKRFLAHDPVFNTWYSHLVRQIIYGLFNVLGIFSNNFFYDWPWPSQLTPSISFSRKHCEGCRNWWSLMAILYRDYFDSVKIPRKINLTPTFAYRRTTPHFTVLSLYDL